MLFLTHLCLLSLTTHASLTNHNQAQTSPLPSQLFNFDQLDVSNDFSRRRVSGSMVYSANLFQAFPVPAHVCIFNRRAWVTDSRSCISRSLYTIHMVLHNGADHPFSSSRILFIVTSSQPMQGAALVTPDSTGPHTQGLSV